MSKYNLTDILNEYIGGGRIGTLNISYRDLLDKMDDLEKSGKAIVRTLSGPSGDGKVNREFEVVTNRSAVPGGNKQERGFTVYDYKFGFDPGSEEHFMEEYPFSVGGNDLDFAMELIPDVKPYGLRETIAEGNLDDLRKLKDDLSSALEALKKKAKELKLNVDFGDATQAVNKYIEDVFDADYKRSGGKIDENIPPSRDDKIIKDLAKADEVIKMIKMMNPDVREDLLMRIARMGQKLNEGDLFSSEFDRQELKAIINDLNKGLILDMPTRRAYKFLVSLLDKEDKEEMGLDEQMYIDDDEFNKEMGRSKKDALRQEMMFHVDQFMDGNIDKNDFMNVVDDIMMDLGLKEVMGIDRKGRKKPESKSNMTKVSEEEMISKAKYDKLLDNAADRYDELEMQFTKFIKDEYNKDFDIDDFRQFQVDNSIMEDEDMTKLKENFKRFM